MSSWRQVVLFTAFGSGPGLNNNAAWKTPVWMIAKDEISRIVQKQALYDI